MTIFTIPKMEYTKVDNGWKMSMDCYPFRAHYIKLYRKRFDGSEYPTSDWMLDHVECIREDMIDYINLMFHAQVQEGLVSDRQLSSVVEH